MEEEYTQLNKQQLDEKTLGMMKTVLEALEKEMGYIYPHYLSGDFEKNIGEDGVFRFEIEYDYDSKITTPLVLRVCRVHYEGEEDFLVCEYDIYDDFGTPYEYIDDEARCLERAVHNFCYWINEDFEQRFYDNACNHEYDDCTVEAWCEQTGYEYEI